MVISVVVYKCRNVGAYPESEEDDEDAQEMLDVSEYQQEVVNDFMPKSSSEKYQSKTHPADQAFI